MIKIMEISTKKKKGPTEKGIKKKVSAGRAGVESREFTNMAVLYMLHVLFRAERLVFCHPLTTCTCLP